MIITDTVETKIAGNTIKYLIGKGYWGNVGDLITVNVSDLKKTSHCKVEVCCENCSHISITSIRYYFSNKNKTGFYTCKKCNYVDRSSKRIETNNQLDVDGIRFSKKIAEKSKNTILKNGGYSFISKKSASKRKEIGENGLSSYQNAARSKSFKEKRRKTMERLKIWIPNTELSDFKIYRRMVRNITRIQNISSLANFNKRGRKYHLDHKFSIFEGFNQKIPPFIIGNICNLQILAHKENILKGYSCSISSDELINKFYSTFNNIHNDF